jgi:hypothetical protein
VTVLKADPKYRHKLLVLYITVATLGVGLTLWGLPALEIYLKQKEPSEAIPLLQVLLALLFVPILPMAFYTYRFANSTLSDYRSDLLVKLLPTVGGVGCALAFAMAEFHLS